MKPILFKEYEYQSLDEIKEKFSEFSKTEDSVFNIVIRRLKNWGFIKSQKQNNPEDPDEIYDKETENKHLCFCFVGAIVISGFVLVVYPKYFGEYDENKMKTVFRVIEKYKNSKKGTSLQSFEEDENTDSFNILSAELYLLRDYWENGLYNNDRIIFEHNGFGEVNWDKTVNSGFAVLKNNRPYYTDMFTRKRMINENDFIRRLHACILTDISTSFAGEQSSEDEKNEGNILSLFDMEPVFLSEETKDDLGDKEYLTYRLEQELRVQFNTRKIQLLKAMLAYIQNSNVHRDTDFFSVYGTKAFNMVWQDVCSEVFRNKLNSSLAELDLGKYAQNGKDKLISLIDKPHWSAAGKDSTETLEPDIISIEDNGFFILDAKYYNPTIKLGELSGVPGVGDITKQYLYQQAFHEILGKYEVFNCLLFPCDKDRVEDKDTVNIDFMDSLKLEKIEVRYLPADEMFKAYLYNRSAKDNKRLSEDIKSFLQFH